VSYRSTLRRSLILIIALAVLRATAALLEITTRDQWQWIARPR
jgi:hypothetical protein